MGSVSTGVRDQVVSLRRIKHRRRLRDCIIASLKFPAPTLLLLLVGSDLLPLVAALQDSPEASESAERGPEFVAPIGNVTAQVGREATLTCTVHHLGHYKVGWLKAEDQTVLSLHTKVVTDNGRISVWHDGQRTWRLHIRQLKQADEGCYMCQVNSARMDKQVGCVRVQVPPDILYNETSADVSVLEGEDAALLCRASGQPLPRVTWRREDGRPLTLRPPRVFHPALHVEAYNGSRLQLWRVERSQMGAFLCIASNDVPPAVSKRIFLSVNFAPVVRVPIQLMGAPLGTDVTLECYVEAFPNTVNYWLKNRDDMLLGGFKYSIGEKRSGYKTTMWLVIRSFSRPDVGTYNCISTNSLGRGEGTLRLYEIKIPDGFVNSVTGDHEAAIEGLTESGSEREPISHRSGNAESAGPRTEPRWHAPWLLLLAPTFSLSSLR